MPWRQHKNENDEIMKKIKYGSVCSGIEAATVAWHPLGWQPAWFAEIEPFPSAVLAHHYPGTENLGDMTKIAARIQTGEVEAPDVLVGGTPCQAFSIAGLRESLNDERGQLSLAFVNLANQIDKTRKEKNEQPAIIVWENVPGVLNTKDNAFGCFLAGLAGEGEPLQPPGGRWSNAGAVFGPQRAIAWRVLDAQHFGVAQRRRRVFVVASSGNGANPAEILFELAGVRRDSAPRREAGQEIAGTIDASIGRSRGAGTNPGAIICMAHGQGGAEIAEERGTTLTCNHESPIVFINQPYQSISGALNAQDGNGVHGQALDDHKLIPMSSVAIAWSEELTAHIELAGTLQYGGQGGRHDGVMTRTLVVRRLTPIECERLQGFPDNYTAIPWRRKPAENCPDGPRYKALGNSMAVPVMHWIGQRIEAARLAALGIHLLADMPAPADQAKGAA